MIDDMWGAFLWKFNAGKGNGNQLNNYFPEKFEPEILGLLINWGKLKAKEHIEKSVSGDNE